MIAGPRNALNNAFLHVGLIGEISIPQIRVLNATMWRESLQPLFISMYRGSGQRFKKEIKAKARGSKGFLVP